MTTYQSPTDEQLRDMTPEASWLALRADPRIVAATLAGLAAELLATRISRDNYRDDWRMVYAALGEAQAEVERLRSRAGDLLTRLDASVGLTERAGKHSSVIEPTHLLPEVAALRATLKVNPQEPLVSSDSANPEDTR